MKVSDYIVKLLEEQNITDVFGIPGVGCGHFMNSLIGSKIKSHLVYNEQGAAFAACGYAQASNRIGMAYTTAGPGGTNLITGIANAYADSIPTLFMVGEKDLKELRGSLRIRQKASQEVDIVKVAEPITKWSYQVKRKEEVRYVFEKAFYLAKNGRPGPVLIDMPSDIAREDIDVSGLDGYAAEGAASENETKQMVLNIIKELNHSSRPLLLVGNAVKQGNLEALVTELSDALNIPFVSTLIAFDIFTGNKNYLGFFGMDGDPSANKAVGKCDLLITLGARLNFKQIGYKRDEFAKDAKIIRIDIDPEELRYDLGGREKTYCADAKNVLSKILQYKDRLTAKDDAWKNWCIAGKENSVRKGSLNPEGDRYMAEICSGFPKGALIAVDTGSHRRWLMSQIQFKEGQRVYQSSGLASMGYALPAAIGIHYASKKPVICVDGDGGIMMNLQEMQMIRREGLPITVFVFNNHELGDIMEFQKKVFHGEYFATTENSGYLAADYEAIAKAFHFDYMRVETIEDAAGITYDSDRPRLIEVMIPRNE